MFWISEVKSQISKITMQHSDASRHGLMQTKTGYNDLCMCLQDETYYVHVMLLRTKLLQHIKIICYT